MLHAIVAVLLVIWLLGLGPSYTLGGLLHIPLILAVVLIAVRRLDNRTPA